MMRSVPGDPEKLGGYWLAGRLGAGRHGVVYDAYDGEGRRFAVRVPRGPLPRLRPVTHPHLAGVLEVRPGYVVSEFAAGPSLRDALGSHGPYAGEELVALAAAVGSALACLHAAGLVHGDLRPGKVLLAEGGPKVICPGAPGSIGATRTYLAPEVVTGEPAGAAGDVFAWGGLVLFAATGEDPFRGGSMGELMHRLLCSDPDLTVLPPRLRDLVGRALAKDPSARPAAADLPLPTPARVAPLPGPPALGEVAEKLYASLTPTEQDRLKALLTALAATPPDRPATPSGTPSPTRTPSGRFSPRTRNWPDNLSASSSNRPDSLSPAAGPGVGSAGEPVPVRLLESGLLVRPSVAVPPTRTETGTLVAVTGDRIAPATAALFYAWPRLRGWLGRPREETHSWARACLPAHPRPHPPDRRPSTSPTGRHSSPPPRQRSSWPTRRGSTTTDPQRPSPPTPQRSTTPDPQRPSPPTPQRFTTTDPQQPSPPVRRRSFSPVRRRSSALGRSRVSVVAVVAAVALAVSVVTVVTDSRTMRWLGDATSRVAPILPSGR